MRDKNKTRVEKLEQQNGIGERQYFIYYCVDKLYMALGGATFTPDEFRARFGDPKNHTVLALGNIGIDAW